MKKLLCIVLALSMLFSCVSMSVSAKGEDDYYYRPDGVKDDDGTPNPNEPNLVGLVIDPIFNPRLEVTDSEFAKNINELGFAGVNYYAANNLNITEETFDSFLAANSTDKLFGVTYDILYSKNNAAYFWAMSNYPLEAELTDAKMAELLAGLSSVDSVKAEWKADHPGKTFNAVQKFKEDWQKSNPGEAYTIHNVEMYAAEKEGRRSTCALKGMYDNCAEVLNGYRYDYSTKSIDQGIFDDIIESKVVFRNSYNKRDEIHYNYSFDLTKGDFSLVRANANSQILNTICRVWNSDVLFATKEAANKNAIKIANFIGNLLYPSFTEIPEDRIVFTDSKKLTAYNFFTKVSEISGLAALLDDYWCNASNFDVKTVMYAFGVNIEDDVLLNIETEKGLYMGARILTDIFRNFFKNPVLYVENLIQMFCKGYTYTYQRAFEELFTLKYSWMNGKSRTGEYPELDKYDGNELKSVDGLINFITDCIYVSKVDNGDTSAKKFSFAPLPAKRIATASDADELHLYYLCYFELNRIYENNGKMIESFITNIITALRPAYEKYLADKEAAKENENNKNEEDEEEEIIKDPNKDMVTETERVLRSLFLGELTMMDVFSFHLTTLTQNTIDNFSESFMSNIKNAIANLFQKFIDAMDSFMNLLFGWTGGILG